jgi:hypothetical protein
MGDTLGDASVQYNDMRGTVAIDGPDFPEELYQLAGLDRDEWSIVGYEIYGGYEASYAHVWAMPIGSATYEDLKTAAARGETTIKARRFDFLDGEKDAAVKLLELNKRWSIHVRGGGFVEHGLDLEDDSD